MTVRSHHTKIFHNHLFPLALFFYFLLSTPTWSVLHSSVNSFFRQTPSGPVQTAHHWWRFRYSKMTEKWLAVTNTGFHLREVPSYRGANWEKVDCSPSYSGRPHEEVSSAKFNIGKPITTPYNTPPVFLLEDFKVGKNNNKGLTCSMKISKSSMELQKWQLT